ncbi:MAG: helicase-related protein, partial [Chloroflexota bacterium]|nr:helicase-related protein [Chloroflexota bacterium]
DLRKSAHNLFIVDNSDQDWKVADYLCQWTEIANAFDIATGYFEIGALLELDGYWQKLDQIRILMGDEVSRRTKRAFEEGLTQILGKLEASLEAAKEDDDFLTGVPGIVAAIKSGRILARVYRLRKFHAKAYITHGKMDVIGSTALVGSSNFTCPGLTQNVELNVQLQREVERLQEWYEAHWNQAEDVTPEILRTIERHTREYSPFEVYLRAMLAYFQGHEPSVDEWEKTESKVYPILDQYQKDGYQAMMRIARRYNGALLCDGVGLGKTFVGLMLIERLLFDRKRIALLVPKPARVDVWETKLKRYLPKAGGKYSNLAIFNHTDLLRGGKFPEWLEEVREEADAIIIDEAHHFRNLSSNRYHKLYEIIEGKQLFMLTATPINNSLYDLMHMIELFSRREPGYFSDAPLGIHTLRGHFRRMEKALQALVGEPDGGAVEVDALAAEEIMSKDDLFQALVVQRSRAYVKRSLQQHGGRQVIFPQREDPRVAPYSLAQTYGGLLDKIEEAFNKDNPLLRLAIYSPLAYYRGDDATIDPLVQGRQQQVVGLIRTLLLKRFESSAASFQASCENLLLKLLYFIRLHNPRTAKRWEAQHAALLERIRAHQQQRGWKINTDEDADEDLIPEEAKKKIELLDDKMYNVAEIVMDTMLDLDALARFLDELRDFCPAQDDKLQQLVHLLQTDPTLQVHKVLIFTEYLDTARYLKEHLAAAGIDPLDEVDSMTRRSRSDIIRAFSPYYNESSSAELAAGGKQEIRVLISTDVLSEGLNLQDATCIINYDLHWNPVRLMQRVGRVDRRLDPTVEAQMIADHPELAAVRGTVYLWNFLPPEELNRILSLYERVTHKTLRISKTVGIEGKKLLTPEDDYEALRNFNQAYEGVTTSVEELHLAYQQLVQEYPALVEAARAMPLRVFSGKAFDAAPSDAARALFFCYQLPAKDVTTGEWSDEAGFTKWYLYRLATGEIEHDATRIFEFIQCTPETPRQTVTPKLDLIEIRKRLDKHVKQTYLRKVQAPIGVKSTLLAWMELV